MDNKELEIILNAANDKDVKNDFLMKEEQHILKLTAKICGKSLSMSDDEWSVGLNAMSYAIDTYNPDKGKFWSYAAIVIKSRLTDHYRKVKGSEVLVDGDAFSGVLDEEANDSGLRREIASKTMVTDYDPVRDEIEALTEELSDYNISFFDLAGNSPKAGKTKDTCVSILKAIFTPPPLTESIKSNKSIPVKELSKRLKFSKKLTDRYRKYLIVSTLILDGDYPELSEYLHDAKMAIKSIDADGR
jgi:RNA polymerase sigma factor